MRTTRAVVAESTNEMARSFVHSAGAGFGPVRSARAFIAERQTAARGRMGRPWHSPEGCVALTVAWPVGSNPDASASVPLLAAMAAWEAVVEEDDTLLEDRLRIKWPNDLLVDGSKLGGILCERVHAAAGAWVLVGIGINADVDPAELADLGQPAVSLRGVLHRPINTAALADRVVQRLEAWMGVGGPTLPEPAAAALAARLAHVGKNVLVAAPGREADGFVGTFEGIDTSGHAIVVTKAGRRKCPSGELSLRVRGAGV